MDQQSQQPISPLESSEKPQAVSPSTSDPMQNLTTAGLPKSPITPLSSPVTGQAAPLNPVTSQIPPAAEEPPKKKLPLSLFVIVGVFAVLGILLTAGLLWYESVRTTTLPVTPSIVPTNPPSPTVEVPVSTATEGAVMTGDSEVDKSDKDIQTELEVVNTDLQSVN